MAAARLAGPRFGLGLVFFLIFSFFFLFKDLQLRFADSAAFPDARNGGFWLFFPQIHLSIMADLAPIFGRRRRRMGPPQQNHRGLQKMRENAIKSRKSRRNEERRRSRNSGNLGKSPKVRKRVPETPPNPTPPSNRDQPLRTTPKIGLFRPETTERGRKGKKVGKKMEKSP